MLTQQLRLYCSVKASLSLGGLHTCVCEGAVVCNECTCVHASGCVKSTLCVCGTRYFRGRYLAGDNGSHSEGVSGSFLRRPRIHQPFLRSVPKFLCALPQASSPHPWLRVIGREQERMLWSMNNWGEGGRERCVNWPLAVASPLAYNAKDATINIYAICG